ncbi:hypothetical protein ASPWEDRAFT_41037 [Aspergillus wentii DTO 134E9]|uniref:NmrA-like domain-containing protein n=1 Tax=Aspergillus wentii DTO 134E9 TaxID=1073089 RepID=A0A1L9RLT7_ASPWE|nr:uncharacterized protein ASPWEDRAFT_41037 [Aspergillus wentii DTO 134E9]KAI9929744.1 hypothetical protein MW887_001220 [Aspergillus wentii]OJJ35797.1 hypothetical protein ASPWEDRAFT_41037 [Aspergillus wentii DTO 134E9]
MTTRQRVLLLGATGETGGSILEGLLAADQYDVEILVRPSSASKQSVKDLVDRGVQLRVFDLCAPQSEITSALSGIDILISAIGPRDLLQQEALVRAAKEAGVKRFIPCAFITIAPPTGAMLLRDEKEEIYNEIKRVELPYTVIDVGFWHQISFPSVPSGRVDYANFGPDATIHGDGDAPNILTDLRDIGRFVARIIADDRTLNQFVYTCGDVLTENEIFGIVEELSGEKIERTFETSQQIEQKVEDAVSDLAQNPDDLTKRMAVWIAQYNHSKYVRKDNRPDYAKYLGYLDARELYPDLVPVSFRDYFLEVLDGKGKRPYMG